MDELLKDNSKHELQKVSMRRDLKLFYFQVTFGCFANYNFYHLSRIQHCNVLLELSVVRYVAESSAEGKFGFRY